MIQTLLLTRRVAGFSSFPLGTQHDHRATQNPCGGTGNSPGDQNVPYTAGREDTRSRRHHSDIHRFDFDMYARGGRRPVPLRTCLRYSHAPDALSSRAKRCHVTLERSFIGKVETQRAVGLVVKKSQGASVNVRVVVVAFVCCSIFLCRDGRHMFKDIWEHFLKGFLGYFHRIMYLNSYSTSCFAFISQLWPPNDPSLTCF